MGEIEVAINKMGFDGEMAANLIEIVRISVEAGREGSLAPIKAVENEIARKLDQLDEYIDRHCQGDSPEKVHARTIAEGRKLQAHMDLILVSRAISQLNGDVGTVKND